jgi:para-aminobenzoate synthetase component 1
MVDTPKPADAETTGLPLPLAEFPLVEELSPPPDPEAAFLRFAGSGHAVFFDSARRDAVLGRYSFLACDPFAWTSYAIDDAGALGKLRAALEPFSAARRPDLPPFQGGAAGLFSYDLGRQLERLPTPRFDEFRLPALAFGLYDTVLAWDHVANRAWIVSQGFPETDPAARRRRAAERLDEVKHRLHEPSPPREEPSPPTEAATIEGPQFEIAAFPGLQSNFTPHDYRAMVRRGVEYIRAGDIFQVNLAQRLLYPANDDSVSLYIRMRRRNPATFAAYFDLGDEQIVSASPERYLRAVDGAVEARPIKGTRLRTKWPEADLFAAADLVDSEKDRAENVMIVDLLRNDLSKVCRADGVRVPQLCGLESYEYVQHLVSSVEGRLREGCDALDAFEAAFPGGSITGAPKIRAMEIIAELEPHARGAYCGSLAYVGFDGSLDASILIRTVTAAGGWWQAPVGGGVTSRSDPQHEYEETWHKAEGLLRALRP